jgi:hypothetical protein
MESLSVARLEHIFSSQRMLRKDYYRKSSVEKISGRGSQGADAKMNWLAVERQS